jgi:CBS domain containing-hemolysin-like protein
VHQRNLLIALTRGEREELVKKYVWEAMMVPESRLIDDLLRDMREKRTQLAVVVSEYGSVVGVVGIEDIIEELIGEIIDEKDVAPEFIKRVSKIEIIVHGQTRISYLNHFFNTEIKSKKTVNGFLMEHFGRVPKIGEAHDYKDLIFTVEAATTREVDRVRIVKKEG